MNELLAASSYSSSRSSSDIEDLARSKSIDSMDVEYNGSGHYSMIILGSRSGGPAAVPFLPQRRRAGGSGRGRFYCGSDCAGPGCGPGCPSPVMVRVDSGRDKAASQGRGAGPAGPAARASRGWVGLGVTPSLYFKFNWRVRRVTSFLLCHASGHGVFL